MRESHGERRGSAHAMLRTILKVMMIVVCMAFILSPTLAPAAWFQLGDYLNSQSATPNPPKAGNGLNPKGTLFQGRPHAIFEEFYNGTSGLVKRIYVRYWTGSIWTNRGICLNYNQNTSAENPQLVADSDDLYACWSEGGKIYVKRWNGLSWAWFPNATPLNINASKAAGRPAVALEEGGFPYVAWCERSGQGIDRVYVKKYNGSSWELVPSAVTALNHNSNHSAEGTLSIAVFGGTPFVAWAEKEEYGFDGMFVKFNHDGGATPYSVSHCTFMGSISEERATAVVRTSDAHTWIVGYTSSPDYPAGLNGIGGHDLFAYYLDDNHTQVRSFRIGGTGHDAIDEAAPRAFKPASGTGIWVIGTTGSTDFPVTAGTAYQARFGGGEYDVFLAKLETDGTVSYATYIGGWGNDVAEGACTDADGNIYIVGWTTSTNLPAINGCPGGRDGFVVKLSPDGRQLGFCRYVGGSSVDGLRGVAVDHAGNIYLTGATWSSDFPVNAPGPLPGQSSLKGGRDGVVLKLDSVGQMQYSTFLGGSDWDYGFCVAVDSLRSETDIVYVGGFTHGSFPVTAGSAQTQFGGYGDGYIVKLNLATNSVVYSTYLGGQYWEAVSNLKVKDGVVYIAGGTQSPGDGTKPFWTSANAIDRVNSVSGGNQGNDACFTILNSEGTQWLYSTFYGPEDSPRGTSFCDFAMDDDGAVYFAGYSNEPLETTPGAMQTTYDGEDGSGLLNLRVKSYNGSGWDPPGDVLASSRVHLNPTLAFPRTGQIFGPYLIYAAGNAEDYTNIYVKKLVGSTWSQVGSALGYGHTWMPSLAFHKNVPYAAYLWGGDFGKENYKLAIKHFNGASWVTDGTSLNIENDAYAPTLSGSPGDTEMLVLWTEGDGCRVRCKMLPYEDHFVGYPDTGVPYWKAELEGVGPTLTFKYAADNSYAHISRTEYDRGGYEYGQIYSPPILYNSTFKYLHIKADEISSDAAWLLELTNESGQNIKLVTRNKWPGVFSVNIQEALAAAGMDWTGKTFRVFITVEGDTGKRLKVDYLRMSDSDLPKQETPLMAAAPRAIMAHFMLSYGSKYGATTEWRGWNEMQTLLGNDPDTFVHPPLADLKRKIASAFYPYFHPSQLYPTEAPECDPQGPYDQKSDTLVQRHVNYLAELELDGATFDLPSYYDIDNFEYNGDKIQLLTSSTGWHKDAMEKYLQKIKAHNEDPDCQRRLYVIPVYEDKAQWKWVNHHHGTRQDPGDYSERSDSVAAAYADLNAWLALFNDPQYSSFFYKIQDGAHLRPVIYIFSYEEESVYVGTSTPDNRGIIRLSAQELKTWLDSCGNPKPILFTSVRRTRFPDLLEGAEVKYKDVFDGFIEWPVSLNGESPTPEPVPAAPDGVPVESHSIAEEKLLWRNYDACSQLQLLKGEYKIICGSAWPGFHDKGVLNWDGSKNRYIPRKDASENFLFDYHLERISQENYPIKQIATFNDWFEGTNIEPSIEFYEMYSSGGVAGGGGGGSGSSEIIETLLAPLKTARDKIAQMRNIAPNTANLILPYWIFTVRNAYPPEHQAQTDADNAESAIRQGDYVQAEATMGIVVQELAYTRTPTPTLTPTPTPSPTMTVTPTHTHSATATPTPTATMERPWLPMGGVMNVNPGLRGFNPAMAILNETPYAAWEEDKGDDKNLIYVKRWMNGSWQSVGGALNVNTQDTASSPEMAVLNSQVYVAWDEGNKVYVKRWDGSQWLAVGGALNQDLSHEAHYPVLAVGNGVLYAAFWERNSQGVAQVYVKHYDGSAWVAYGVSLNVDPAFDAMGAHINILGETPYVAFSQQNASGIWEVFVKHYDGTSWIADSGSLNVSAASNGGSPYLGFVGNVPYVCFSQGDWGAGSQVYVKRLVNSDWELVGSSLNVDSGDSAVHPTFAVIDGVPYATWYEDGLKSNIYVKHWDGQAWIRDCPALNANPESSEWAYHPFITGSLDRPCVIWMEQWNIYAKRMNGSVNAFWNDDFEGAPGARPLGWWGGQTPEYQADITTSYSHSLASVTRTAGEAWGKVVAPAVQCSVDEYPWVEVKVARLSPGRTWKLGIQETGSPYRYWDLSSSNTGIGTFTYNYKDVTGWSGNHIFALQITLEGDPGSFMEIDYACVRRPSIAPTVTPTPTPYPANAWSDEFIGTPFQKPTLWQDNRDQSGFNAEINYSCGASLAAVTRTAQDTWGKVLSPAITCDTTLYNTVEVRVVSVKPSSSWKLGIQEVGGSWTYHDLGPASTATGTFQYDLAAAMAWTGEHTFQVQLVVEGIAGKGVEVDWLRVCQEGTVHGASVRKSGLRMRPMAQPAAVETETPGPTTTVTATATPTPWAQSGQVIAYPNPGRERVTFAYTVAGPVQVAIDIYTIAGERVAHLAESQDGSAGQTLSTVWRTGSAASGIYFARIVIKDGQGNEVVRKTKKVAIIR